MIRCFGVAEAGNDRLIPNRITVVLVPDGKKDAAGRDLTAQINNVIH